MARYTLPVQRAIAVIGMAIWVGACGAAGGKAPSSGVVGIIVAAPVCPVQTVPSPPRCAPRPLVADVRIYRLGGHSRAVMVRSGPDGRFRIVLPAARYLVEPLPKGGSRLPRPPAAFQVSVEASRFTHIRVTYDSGIR